MDSSRRLNEFSSFSHGGIGKHTLFHWRHGNSVRRAVLVGSPPEYDCYRRVVSVFERNGMVQMLKRVAVETEKCHLLTLV